MKILFQTIASGLGAGLGYYESKKLEKDLEQLKKSGESGLIGMVITGFFFSQTKEAPVGQALQWFHKGSIVYKGLYYNLFFLIGNSIVLNYYSRIKPMLKSNKKN